nr:glycosyltransferase [uncultured Mucilaginibacter sp.]
MFSVLVPAYKSKYLAQAIESILNQTFEDFELIIVNDKSPEDIQSIVKTFADPRIRYFENDQNLGGTDVVGNWNNCLSHATQPFGILFSDDDVLEPAFLAEIKGLIDRYPQANIFCSRVAIIDSESNLLRLTPSAPERLTTLDFIWHRVYGFREIFAQNYVFKTAAIREIGGFIDFPLAWGTDDATWFTLSKTHDLISTTKVLCNWRWSELNISNVGNIEKRIDAVIKFYNWLEQDVKAYTPKDDLEQHLKEAIIKRLPQRKLDSIKYLIDSLLKNNNAQKALKIFNQIASRYNDINYKLLAVAVAKKFLKKT